MTTAAWLIVCVAAFAAGRGYQAAVRAWHDYQTTKAQVPVLFWAAVTATRAAVGTVVAAAVLAGAVLYGSSDGP